MSKTYFSLPFGVTVYDIEHLPEGMDQEDVVEQVRDVVNSALSAWYKAGGEGLVSCEPSC